jgi:hypothetical protein
VDKFSISADELTGPTVALFGPSLLETMDPALVGKPANEGPASKEAGTPVTVMNWPSLSDLGLSADEQRARRLGIGGSDANTILSGEPEKVIRLWEEKRGVREAPELSGHLPVALGCWTEAFNRQWYEHLTGYKVVGVGSVISCPIYDWRRCTLAGIVEKPAQSGRPSTRAPLANPTKYSTAICPSSNITWLWLNLTLPCSR